MADHDEVVTGAGMDHVGARDADRQQIVADSADQPLVARTASRGNGRDGCAESRTEDDVSLAGVVAAVVAIWRADDDIAEAVAVNVRGGGDAAARKVAGGIAFDSEAAVGRKIADVHDLLVHGKRVLDVSKADSPAKQHVSRSGIVRAAVVFRRADDEVGETVAVHVARGRDALPRFVAAVFTVDTEALEGRNAVELDQLTAVG